MACSRLFTFPTRPPLPLRRVPRLRRRIALSTVLPAALPYFRRLDLREERFFVAIGPPVRTGISKTRLGSTASGLHPPVGDPAVRPHTHSAPHGTSQQRADAASHKRVSAQHHHAHQPKLAGLGAGHHPADEDCELAPK